MIMNKDENGREECLNEIEDLRIRLEEAQETLNAIRSGQVDAVVVTGREGEQVFTLKGADYTYRHLVDHMKEGAFTLTEDGTLLYVNSYLAEMLNTPVKDLVSTSFYDLMAPEDHPLCEAILKVGRKGPVKLEITFRSKDGSPVPTFLSINPLRVEERVILCGVATDLMDQKRNQELLASERLARTIFEQAAEAIVVCDEKGRILRANQMALKLCGRNPLLQPFEEVFPLRIVPMKVFPSKEEGIKGEPLSLDRFLRGERMRGIEATFTLKDGQERHLLLSTSPLLGPSNHIIGCVITLMDISLRKQMEEELNATNQYLEMIIDNANVWLEVHDNQGNVVIWNKAAEAISGYSREEVVGHGKIWEWLYPEKEYQNKVRAKAEDIIEKGEVVEDYETTIRRKDGETRIISWHSRNLVDASGSPTGSVALGRDVTEIKRLEDQLRQSQKMEAIGTLAGGVAHDFNNLLTTIIGNAQLALMDLNPQDPLYEEIEEIQKAGEKAASLTRQLLAFSRKQVIQPRAIDLNEVITSAKKMLMRLIGEDIELRTHLDPELWKVYVDQGQMDQVIINLAVNARDAMPEGGTLTIETANVDLDMDTFLTYGVEERPGPYVMLTVRDTGVGMDKEVQSRIFEPFFTTKERERGTGLGLSTVYGIVKQSKGFIWVESEKGRGSTFRIYLPMVEGDMASEGEEKDPLKGIGGSETVLVVEDDEMLRDLVQKTLERCGYRVLGAKNGEDALRVGEDHKGPIHLMITDVVMPRMSGKDMAERLKALHPETKVIYMSGYTDKEIVHRGVLAKGVNFIQKPFPLKDLAQRIREVLDQGIEDGI